MATCNKREAVQQYIDKMVPNVLGMIKNGSLDMHQFYINIGAYKTGPISAEQIDLINLLLIESQAKYKEINGSNKMFGRTGPILQANKNGTSQRKLMIRNMVLKRVPILLSLNQLLLKRRRV